MKYTIGNIILLLMTLAAISCSSTQNDDGLAKPVDTNTSTSTESKNSIEGIDWHLVQLDGQPVGASPRPPFINLDSAGNNLTGSGGCNHLMGNYELDGSGLRFPMVGGTKMACSEGMDVESSFMKALQSTARFELRDDHLELQTADGAVVALLQGR